jgi:hypothetical protein
VGTLSFRHRMKQIFAICLSATVLGWVVRAEAEGPEISFDPNLETEVQGFPYYGQRDLPLWRVSIALDVRFAVQSEARDHALVLRPFGRLDSRDRQRTHYDVREGYWSWNRRNFELQVGAGIVFWGVAESRHLVDVINQDDFVEGPSQKAKLGQPMVRFSYRPAVLGQLELFLLPYFRERTFPGPRGRPGFPIPVDASHAMYASPLERLHPDAAFRWSNRWADLDWALSYFWGNSREPQLPAYATPMGTPALVPWYDLIHQGGGELQWTRDSWLLKLEAMIRQGQGVTFGAAVGGLEYTFFDVLGTGLDIGLVAEGGYDGRENLAPVVMDHDVFGGLRFAANDTQSTELLVGAIVDVEHAASVIRVEGSRRFGEQIKLAVEAYAFLPSQQDDIVSWFQYEDVVSLDLITYF